MIARRQVILAHAVPFAGLYEVAGIIEAQIGHDILGPAEAVGGAFEPIFGCKNAVAPARRRQSQKIGLIAEQAKTVLDLPNDTKVACSRKWRSRAHGRRGSSADGAAGGLRQYTAERGEGKQQSRNDGKAHFSWAGSGRYPF